MSLISKRMNKRAICIVENSINILFRRLSPCQERIASVRNFQHTMSGATSQMSTTSNFSRKTKSFLENREMLGFVSHRPSSSLTNGDRNLLQFLKEEIKYEEGNVIKIPKFKDFEVDMKDTLVTLKRNIQGERIVVSFDVNENVNVDESGVTEEDEVNDEDVNVPDITSYPVFTVNVSKSLGSTLQFTCTCNTGIHEEEEDSEEEFDIFKIDSVKVYNKKEGQSTYEAETETMDGELYGILMTMLLERGITGTFINDLLDLSTSVEHRHYLSFLMSLRDFVNAN